MASNRDRKLPVVRAAYLQADEQRVRAARMAMFNAVRIEAMHAPMALAEQIEAIANAYRMTDADTLCIKDAAQMLRDYAEGY